MPSPLCPLCRLPFDPKKVDKATHVEKQLSSYKAPCRGCNKKVPTLLGFPQAGEALGGAVSTEGSHSPLEELGAWAFFHTFLSVEPHLLQSEASHQTSQSSKGAMLSKLPDLGWTDCTMAHADSAFRLGQIWGKPRRFWGL